MEIDLNADPLTYEARPIFGAWSRREAVVGACVVVAVAAASTVAWQLGADPLTVGGVTALCGVPVGVFGLARRHGLRPEQWVPVMRAERQAPRERIYMAPTPRLAWDEVEVPETRAERRQAKQRQRELGLEMETDDCLARYLLMDDEGNVLDGDEGGSDGR